MICIGHHEVDVQAWRLGLSNDFVTVTFSLSLGRSAKYNCLWHRVPDRVTLVKKTPKNLNGQRKILVGMNMWFVKTENNIEGLVLLSEHGRGQPISQFLTSVLPQARPA